MGLDDENLSKNAQVEESELLVGSTFESRLRLICLRLSQIATIATLLWIPISGEGGPQNHSAWFDHIWMWEEITSRPGPIKIELLPVCFQIIAIWLIYWIAVREFCD